MGICLVPENPRDRDEFIDKLNSVPLERSLNTSWLAVWAEAGQNISKFGITDTPLSWGMSLGTWQEAVDLSNLGRALLNFETGHMLRAASVYVNGIGQSCAEDYLAHGPAFRALSRLPPALWLPEDGVADDFFRYLTDVWMPVAEAERETCLRGVRGLVTGLSEVHRRTVLVALGKGARGRCRKLMAGEHRISTLPRAVQLFAAIPDDLRIEIATQIAATRQTFSAEEVAARVEALIDPDGESDHRRRWTERAPAAWQALEAGEELPSVRARRHANGDEVDSDSEVE